MTQSIDITRNTIRLALNDYRFKTETKELDFLIENPDLLEVLPTFPARFRNAFGADSKLTLELFKGGPDWYTLFINVTAHCKWEKCNDFSNSFWKDMFTYFPHVADKFNIDIDSDGI